MTGGTIDSVYDGTKDTAVPREHSIIPQVVNNLRLYTQVKFDEVCMKDSRDITNDDLVKLTEIIEKSESTKVIITHGTYTMPDTARYLEANLQRKDQTIVVTGSYIPIDGFSPSDGTFNLGYAFARVQDLKPGIYVAMNGRVFSPQEIRKAFSEGRFESIYTTKR